MKTQCFPTLTLCTIAFCWVLKVNGVTYGSAVDKDAQHFLQRLQCFVLNVNLTSRGLINILSLSCLSQSLSLSLFPGVVMDCRNLNKQIQTDPSNNGAERRRVVLSLSKQTRDIRTVSRRPV